MSENPLHSPARDRFLIELCLVAEIDRVVIHPINFRKGQEPPQRGMIHFHFPKLRTFLRKRVHVGGKVSLDSDDKSFILWVTARFFLGERVLVYRCFGFEEQLVNGLNQVLYDAAEALSTGKSIRMGKRWRSY
jgi:hypothetical protein